MSDDYEINWFENDDALDTADDGGVNDPLEQLLVDEHQAYEIAGRLEEYVSI